MDRSNPPPDPFPIELLLDPKQGLKLTPFGDAGGLEFVETIDLAAGTPLEPPSTMEVLRVDHAKGGSKTLFRGQPYRIRTRAVVDPLESHPDQALTRVLLGILADGAVVLVDLNAADAMSLLMHLRRATAALLGAALNAIDS